MSYSHYIGDCQEIDEWVPFLVMRGGTPCVRSHVGHPGAEGSASLECQEPCGDGRPPQRWPSPLSRLLRLSWVKPDVAQWNCHPLLMAVSHGGVWKHWHDLEKVRHADVLSGHSRVCAPENTYAGVLAALFLRAPTRKDPEWPPAAEQSSR